MIQLQYQLPQEDLHHFVVGVGLQQRQVEFSFGVQSSEHGDARNYLLPANGIVGVFVHPLHPPEVTHAEPGLVYIQDSLTLLEKLYQVKGKLLSKDQIFL